MALCLLGVVCGPVAAQTRQLARESAEYLLQRFGKQAVREGAEVLAQRIETLAGRHGNEVFQALRKVGPKVFQVVEHAGEHASKAVGIMARHGEPGVAWVLKRPKGMALMLTHGEEAAAVLVRHPGGIVEPVLEQVGKPAVKALQAVGPQSGRRLAIMQSAGDLAKIGRTPELMDVIFRYGEKAMEFIWANKGSLAVGTALAAFLANPEPFVNGVRQLTQIAAENVVRPLAEVPGQVAREAASSVNWTLLAIISALVILVLLLPLSWKFLWAQRA